VVDLAGDVEEEARGRRIRPSLAASGGPVLEFFSSPFFVPGGGGSCGGGEAEPRGQWPGGRGAGWWVWAADDSALDGSSTMGAELCSGEGDDSNRD